MRYTRAVASAILTMSVAAWVFAEEPVVNPKAATPPVAKKVPKTATVHGDVRVDNYFWLREKTNPDVTAYLEAENAYTAAAMKGTEPFQDALYKEILGHIKETDLSVPFRFGGYWYYYRTEQGKQYRIQCRKKAAAGEIRPAPETPEQILLDLNHLAEGQKFMGLGAFSVSDDGNLLAYSTDFTGFRQYTLHVKDLRTGALLPDTQEKVVSVRWAADNKTLFYTIEDAAKRPYRLYRHELWSQQPDALLYEEKDELYRIWLDRSRDQKYLFLNSASSETTEVRCIPSDTPGAALRVILPRVNDHEYYIDHHGDRFYILTNDGAKDFRVVWAPVDDPRKENWKEFLPAREGIRIEGLDMFAHHGVTYEREGGLPKIRIIDLRTGEEHLIEFQDAAYSVFLDANPEFDTTTVRFQYQSMITPSTVYDYDMEKRTRVLMKQTEVPGGFDSANYVAERIFAKAPDGTAIPISIAYRKGLKKDGTAPLHLQGYGSYGFAIPVTFSPAELCLLDRGVVSASAHIRGGGEMGEKWHDDGKMMSKKNTFTDFIAVAEHLVNEKYTSKDRLVIEGGSAGGLLMGAVTNMRPDLFHAIVTHVPFVDVLNTMLDASLPLTVGEYLEWGNPSNKSEYDYMKTYCPYTNLAAKDYPAILVTTSLNDSQVMYWEPAKYVAKLRTLKTDQNPLLLKTNMAAGHGGASGRYDYYKDRGFEFAFILAEMGITR